MSLLAKLTIAAVAIQFAVAVAEADGDRVVVSLYAESLCPDCIGFSQGPLSEAFNKVFSFMESCESCQKGV